MLQAINTFVWIFFAAKLNSEGKLVRAQPSITFVQGRKDANCSQVPQRVGPSDDLNPVKFLAESFNMSVKLAVALMG